MEHIITSNNYHKNPQICRENISKT